MNKIIKKYTAIILAVLLFAAAPLYVNAQNINISKEEVIYANLDSQGNIETAYMVNIFDIKEDVTVVDYGKYTDVKNMTSDAKVMQNGDEITVDAKKGKLYYQGTIEDIQLPWEINIRYILDGKEYSGIDAAGKSGLLELQISIKENRQAKGDFFKNYALQTIVKLDMEICEDIYTEGATEANAGGERQLTYTVLPGKEKDISITSRVTGFKMPGIQFNGIKLNLGIDIPDVADITKDLSDLQKGISEIDSGASEIEKGAASLKEGMDKLNSGAESLKTGMEAIVYKSGDLITGSAQVKSGLDQINIALSNFLLPINEFDELVTGSAAIKGGISDLCDGIASMQEGINLYDEKLVKNSIDKTQLQDNNTAMLITLEKQITQLQNVIAQAKSSNGPADTSTAEAQLENFTQIAMLLRANAGLIEADNTLIGSLGTGIGQLKNGALSLRSQYEKIDEAIKKLPYLLGEMSNKLFELKSAIELLAKQYDKLDSGINQYTDGFTEIVKGYGELYAGILSAAEGTDILAQGTQSLKDGTFELYSKTEGMDSLVEDKIDEVKNILPDNEFVRESFISEKNTNIKYVQFVIKTADIQFNTQQASNLEDIKILNFWQKLLKLFGLYKS